MPSLDDNEIEEMDPSTVSTLDETAAAATAAKPDDADPSTATGETDALSVVRDVVAARAETVTAPPAEGEETGVDAGDDKGEPAKDATEDYSDVPFSKHPRFQQLIREKNSYREDAQRYQNVQGFIDQHGLSAEEAADGLMSLALMKTNPVEAWKRVQPTIQKLLVAAGEVLPDDLRALVQKGEMSKEAAFVTSRDRAAVQSMTVRQTFEQQRAEKRTATEATNALGSAARTWAEDRAAKDPNFEAKQVPLQKEILFLQRQDGVPKTPEGVREQLAKAYKAVNASLPPVVVPVPAAVRKPAITPVVGGQVAGGQRNPNASTVDIVAANRRSA